MPAFTKGPNYRDPFGNFNFLRSTRDVKTISGMFVASTLPFEVVDGVPIKVLRKGEVLAAITSGPNAGNVGVLQSEGTAGTPEQQTLTGTTVTAGSYTISTTLRGDTDVTTALAWNATATQVAAALNLLEGVQDFGSITVTGGPVSTTPLVLTFVDLDGVGQNVPTVVVDATLLTGTIAVTTNVSGVDGPTDGRSVLANIVGINNTYLPWQLLQRDVEVAIVYECAAVQARCYERNGAGARVALTDTTAAAMFAKKNLDIRFPE